MQKQGNNRILAHNISLFFSILSSNLPLIAVSANVIDVHHPPVEVYTEPPTNLLPVSTTVPVISATPRQTVSVDIPGPELETPTVSIIFKLRLQSSSLNTAHLVDVSAHL